jgi:hypothetical protein
MPRIIISVDVYFSTSPQPELIVFHHLVKVTQVLGSWIYQFPFKVA